MIPMTLIVAMESYRCAASSQHARTKFEERSHPLGCGRENICASVCTCARINTCAKWNKIDYTTILNDRDKVIAFLCFYENHRYLPKIDD